MNELQKIQINEILYQNVLFFNEIHQCLLIFLKYWISRVIAWHRLCVLIRQQRYCTRLCIGCMLDVCMRGLKQLRLNFHFHIRCILFQSMFPAMQYQQNFVLWILTKRQKFRQVSKLIQMLYLLNSIGELGCKWWTNTTAINVDVDTCRYSWRFVSIIGSDWVSPNSTCITEHIIIFHGIMH